jgi:hypothetical protein
MRRLGRPTLAAALLLACGVTSAAEPTGTQSVVTQDAGPVGRVGETLTSVWARVTDLDAWQGPGHWRLGIAPVAVHFRPSDEHTNVWGVQLERQVEDQWLAGAVLFRNSFGQPSAYAYIGHRSTGLIDMPPLFFQWTAGLLYGYKGKYKDKVPLNVGGFAPGAEVGLGWQFDKRTSASLHLLGDAGVVLQLAYDFH